MTESLQEELFTEPKSSGTLKVVAGLCAMLLTVGVFAGYTYLRKRHAENTKATAAAALPAAEPRKSPKALVLVDEALLKGGTTTIAGTVKNTSSDTLGPLSVEIELKRRTGGTTEKKLIALQPEQLGPQEEGRYSLQVKAQDYGSARVNALRTVSDAAEVPFTTGLGQKRPLERLESKTVVIDKPRSKGGEFLNTPDNPARVP
jgi:hypothetical protein